MIEAAVVYCLLGGFWVGMGARPTEMDAPPWWTALALTLFLPITCGAVVGYLFAKRHWPLRRGRYCTGFTDCGCGVCEDRRDAGRA